MNILGNLMNGNTNLFSGKKSIQEYQTQIEQPDAIGFDYVPKFIPGFSNSSTNMMSFIPGLGDFGGIGSAAGGLIGKGGDLQGNLFNTGNNIINSVGTTAQGVSQLPSALASLPNTVMSGISGFFSGGTMIIVLLLGGGLLIMFMMRK